MDPLKDHPHLFANGKFRFMDNEGFKWELVGVFDGMLMGEIEGEEVVETYDLGYATLIARPIEDMDRGELAHFLIDPRQTKEEVRQFVRDMANASTLDFEDAMQLLSIGVYPFDQHHFKQSPPIVIDSRKI